MKVYTFLIALSKQVYIIIVRHLTNFPLIDILIRRCLYQDGGEDVYAQDDENTSKQTRVMFELQGLAHTIKRYLNTLAETQGLPKPGTGKGISGTNLFIIGYLYENRDKDVFQKDLEEKMNVRRSTISKVLQIMEAKDLIRREQVEQDGRLKKIVLTETSLEGIRGWLANTKEIESKMTRNFTPEELDQFYYLLNKAKQNFNN